MATRTKTFVFSTLDEAEAISSLAKQLGLQPVLKFIVQVEKLVVHAPRKLRVKRAARKARSFKFNCEEHDVHTNYAPGWGRHQASKHRGDLATKLPGEA